MGVKLTGQKRLEKELQKRFAPERVQQISDKALLEGAGVFVRELKEQFEKFKDEGESIKEITIGDPVTIRGTRTVRVHWKGPHNRYRIIHLNEFGTVKNPNPRGKGAVARALRNAEKTYRETIKRELRSVTRG